ncbi:MAG: LutB/LldF family L-lactate oxidation iron-sulfur protein [Blastocatellia bacterium]|nr:LutB/LldF family L-lactate oxidation iron-sulfur protein [Blastocatellia bacterium]
MDHEINTEGFVDNYRRALADAQLQKALANATSRFTMVRSLAVKSAGEEWERLRTRARAIKEHAINHLDHYLEEFSSNIERLGGHVFWARDADEANDYIAGLARERGVKLAVKSKSMMTEEIELNRALAVAGVEAVETDLGEYIIQLAGERPSHILAPAIHKTRADVADLFAEKLHTERTEEIELMTALARRVLRERFASAGMGVTGANFAVAETGTIVLVENEGNIRLTTTLPRVHVALMGIEKVIPRVEDLTVFLRLLPRSASGQQMSAYVSFLTGVKRSATEEGPEELHVVVLDNGRVDMLANEKLRESLYCIRCGACLNICPVYQKIGGHAYGWIYPGPIGAVLTPQLVGRSRAAGLPFASSLCGACREVCPIKIDIPDMLLHLRHEIKEPGLEGKHESGTAAKSFKPAFNLKHRLALIAERAAFKLWAAVMKSPARYARAARFARLVGQAMGDNGRGLPVARWTATRDLPAVPARSFRERWPEVAAEIDDSGKKRDIKDGR